MYLYLALFVVFFCERLLRHARLLLRLEKELAGIRAEYDAAKVKLPEALSALGEDAGISPDSPAAFRQMELRLLRKRETAATDDGDWRLLTVARAGFLRSRHDVLALRLNSLFGMTPQRFVAAVLRRKPAQYIGDAPRAALKQSDKVE